MTFAKTVGAYLTGWLIVQPLYNRLFREFRKRDAANPSAESRAYWRYQAEAIVDVMEERGHLVRPVRTNRPRRGA